MMRSLRITLVISNLRAVGGAERIMSYMVNWLAGRGHDVTLMLTGSCSVSYELAPRVRVISSIVDTPLGAGIFTRVVYFLKRHASLRKTILSTRPDVVLSFIEGTNARTLMVTMFTGIPVIISERTNPYSHKVSFFIKTLRRLFYPRAAAVVLQTSSLVPWTDGWIKRERVRVIPNPVPTPDMGAGGLPDSGSDGKKRLIAMGRLGPEKGFDMLIGAFAKVAARHPEWSLLIIGDGTMRKTLENQVESLGLSGRVSMPGILNSPAGALKSCDLFALTSRYEGFPNALCEAMACGLPAVSFDCRFGPSEIIRDGVDGVLVPPGDAGALASALDRLMGDDAGRKRMAARAAEIVDRFDFEQIMNAWESLIVEVAGVGKR